MIPEAESVEPLLDVRPTRYKKDANPARIYLYRFSTKASRRTMRKSLEALARIATAGKISPERFPWHRLRYADTAKLRDTLADLYSPKGANLRITALRGVLKECWRLGLMTADDRERASDLARVRGKALLRGRGLAAGELAAVFRVCRLDSRPVGRRDAAIFALMYGAALRRAEVSSLNLADFDPEASRISLKGKGQAERVVPVLANVGEALVAWIQVRGGRAGPLFYPVDAAGHARRGRLSGGAIGHICERRGKAARIAWFTPQDLRRSSVSDLLDTDLDLSAVQQFVGHAKSDTTAAYDRRGERVTRRAAGLLHVPL